MGFSPSIFDLILAQYFLCFFIAVTFIDAQLVFPEHLFPDAFVGIKILIEHVFKDYLYSEKPPFYVAIVWFQILVQGPLALLSFFGIANRSSWLNTTCLIFGVCGITTMVIVLADITATNRGSKNMHVMYLRCLAFSIIAFFRGLVSQLWYSGQGYAVQSWNRRAWNQVM